MRAKLLETERVEALQEEIAGFLLDQVINPKEEYYYPLPPSWKPLPIVIVLRRHQLGYNATGSKGNRSEEHTSELQSQIKPPY